ncbi:MAG: hypothetical protein DCC75_02510 [Proteobacteria bacterium]|nr:MAG: hypothetical protein DCC75_02510 [Pseudomonadota bacterium]
MKLKGYLAINIALLVSSAACAFAQQQTPAKIEINIDAPFEPAEAVGLILSEKGVYQRELDKIERASPRVLVATLSYLKESIPADAVATVLIRSEDGQIAAGSPRLVLTEDEWNSFWSLPQCPPEKFSTSAATETGKLSLLESLVDIRARRRGVAQVQLAKALDQQYIERLRKLEAGFGFSYPEPLSAEMTPVELIDRLTRIVEVINAANQRAPKEKQAK